MGFIGSVFLWSIGSLLIFSGILKMISYKNTINAIANVGIFPQKYAKKIGVILPIFELIVGVWIVINPLIINIILVLGYLIFFLMINLKFSLEGTRKKCCCYGTLISSKLGKGGLIHYIYFILILIIGAIGDIGGASLTNIGNYDAIIKIILAILLLSNGLLIRVITEKYIE